MKKLILLFLVIFVIAIALPVHANDETGLNDRIQECADLFDEIMQMPDKAIPEKLLSKCSGVAIFPSVLKGGFFLGGRYGKGIILYRDKKTNTWSSPAFFTIGGISYGLQFGGQAIDLILVIPNKRGVESLLDNKITIGGDIAAAAGPIGREAEASTDLLFKAGILSYSRSRGLFAGIALKGAVIKPDTKSNDIYYGQDVDVEDILLDKKVKATKSGKELIRVLRKYTK